MKVEFFVELNPGFNGETSCGIKENIQFFLNYEESKLLFELLKNCECTNPKEHDFCDEIIYKLREVLKIERKKKSK